MSAVTRFMVRAAVTFLIAGVLSQPAAAASESKPSVSNFDIVPQGAPQTSTFFADFDAGLPAGTHVTGSAAQVPGIGANGSGGLRLTSAAQSQLGDLYIDSPSGGAAVSSFFVQFNLLIGGGNQADGVSFNFGNLPDDGIGEEGGGNDVVVSFDTYQNPGEGPPGIEVRVGGVLVGQLPGVDIFRGNQFVTVRIQMSTAGLFSLSFGTQFVLVNVPTNYQPIPGRFAFGGRTGALFDNQIIDNVFISTTAAPGTLPPVISCQPTATVGCNDSTDPAFTGGPPTVQFSCPAGGGAPTYTDGPTTQNGNRFVFTRTWTVTDFCGRSSQCTQTIEQNVQPVVTVSESSSNADGTIKRYSVSADAPINQVSSWSFTSAFDFVFLDTNFQEPGVSFDFNTITVNFVLFQGGRFRNRSFAVTANIESPCGGGSGSGNSGAGGLQPFTVSRGGGKVGGNGSLFPSSDSFNSNCGPISYGSPAFQFTASDSGNMAIFLNTPNSRMVIFRDLNTLIPERCANTAVSGVPTFVRIDVQAGETLYVLAEPGGGEVSVEAKFCTDPIVFATSQGFNNGTTIRFHPVVDQPYTSVTWGFGNLESQPGVSRVGDDLIINCVVYLNGALLGKTFTVQLTVATDCSGATANPGVTVGSPQLYSLVRGAAPTSIQGTGLQDTAVIPSSCGPLSIGCPVFQVSTTQAGVLRFNLTTPNSRLLIVRNLSPFPFPVLQCASAGATPVTVDFPVAGPDTLYVFAGNDGAQANFSAALIDPNAIPPTINNLANPLELSQDQSKDFFFDVADNLTPAGNLAVQVTTQAPDLIPQSGITAQNSSGHVRLTLRPASNRAGTGSLQIKVTDSNNNSTTQTVQVTVKVVARPPTITWANPADMVYGTRLGNGQQNANANTPGTYTYTPAPGALLNAGDGQTLTVNFTPTDTVNFTPASKSVLINVKKATLTVIADNQFRNFGASNPNLTSRYSGFVNGEGPGVVNGTPSLSTSALPTSPPGNYPIQISGPGLSAANYQFVFQSGTLTVQRVAETPNITWSNPADITYGRALSDAQLNASANVGGTYAYSPAAGTLLNAGDAQTLTVIFTPSDSVNYNIASKTVLINVKKATLTVIADNQFRNFGAANPIPTYHFAGFVNGDGPGVVTGTPDLSVAASQNSPPGNYPIQVSGQALSAANYQFVYQSGILFVQSVAQFAGLTWSTPADITYGTVLGNGQLNANANTPGTYNYSPAPGTLLNAGDGQTLTVTFIPNDSVNFSADSKSVPINVKKATLTVIADNQTRGFGAPNPTLTSHYAGFVNGEGPGVVSGTPNLSTTASQNSPSGTYPIQVTGPALSAANYQFIFQPGTLTVSAPARDPGLVWSNPADITYGTPLGAAQQNATAITAGDYSYAPAPGTLLKLGDGQALTVTFTPKDLANYQVATKSVLINVKKAPLTVQAANVSKIYGSVDPAFSPSFKGFKNNDTASVVKGGVSFNRDVGQGAGSYAIHSDISQLSADNYIFVAADGILTITKKPIPAFINAASKPYGTIDPPYTVFLDSKYFLAGDSPAVFTGSPKFTRDPGESPGEYSIHGQSGSFAALNYQISTFVDGTFRITKAALDVTVNDSLRPVGTANPSFTVTIKGLASDDQLKLTPGYSTLADINSPAGSYLVKVELGPPSVLANYDVVTHTGILVVTDGAYFLPPSFAGNTLQINLRGKDGDVYLIQSSKSLSGDWKTIKTIIIQGGVGTFLDNEVQNNPKLFYRAVLQ